MFFYSHFNCYSIVYSAISYGEAMALCCRKHVEDDAVDNDPEMTKDSLNVDNEVEDKADPDTDDEGSEIAVIDSQLEMMLEVVLKLRSDPDFARSMYADCPRLQHLLNRNPGLRPFFEDPKLICLNFEKVYQDAGGVLPEDEVDATTFQIFKAWFLAKIKTIIASKYFKIFKFLLIIKKLAGFINPMKGVTILKNVLCGCLEKPESLEDLLDNADADVDASESEIAINKAADYMEMPEVQEEMEQIMQNNDSMEAAIEDNEHLKALRDTNPVARELMSSSESFKALTDPNALRALGEAPNLLELDFAETGTTSGFHPPQAEIDLSGSMADIAEVDEAVLDTGNVESTADNKGLLGEANAEVETEEGGPLAAEDFEYEQENKGGGGKKKKKKGKEKKGGGTMTEAAVGFLGGALVGEIFGGFGGGDDLEGVPEEPAEVEAPVVDVPEEPAGLDVSAADIAGGAVIAATIGGGDLDTMAAHAEDVADTAEDAADDGDKKRATATGGVVVVGADGKERRIDDDETDDDEEVEEDEDKGFFGTSMDVMKDTVKEALAATVIGDDLAEELFEKMDEEDEDSEEEEEEGKEKDTKNAAEEKETKRKGRGKSWRQKK